MWTWQRWHFQNFYFVTRFQIYLFSKTLAFMFTQTQQCWRFKNYLVTIFRFVYSKTRFLRRHDKSGVFKSFYFVTRFQIYVFSKTFVLGFLMRTRQWLHLQKRLLNNRFQIYVFSVPKTKLACEQKDILDENIDLLNSP